MCIRDSIVKGMQLVRFGPMKNLNFSSLRKNASFKKGWLHLAVQCFFAIITVVSFILIVLMAIPRASHGQLDPEKQSRCRSKHCIVYCDGVPYFGQFNEDIVYTVSQLPFTCRGLYLVLTNGMFINQTLKTSAFPRMRVPIYELAIIDGNLNHLVTDSFLNQYTATIRTILFQGLVIKTWSVDSLVGLSNLAHIYIKESKLLNVQPQVLRSVHNTLESITITNSKHWDPFNIVGTARLGKVNIADFSNNIFYDVLNQNSLRGLGSCKILYLNSCKISAIGTGAFDKLHSIETLFLNDNLLITISDGLFHNLLTSTSIMPRINLQDNLWNCDCASSDIRELVNNDMLLTDPTCTSPSEYHGKTFHEFEYYCTEDVTVMESPDPNLPNQSIKVDRKNHEISGVVYVNNGCYNGKKNSTEKTMKMMSPVYDHQCVESKVYKSYISRLSSRVKNYDVESSYSNSDWIKFSFFVTAETHSIVHISAMEADQYGILWYQSTCPNEVYCINTIPKNLKVYDVDLSAEYVFCPVLISSGAIETDKCVNYHIGNINFTRLTDTDSIVLYVSTGGICLVLGAMCVYALVRRHPNLLKGSKRILFVKHKSVDALVLPPKVPLRNENSYELNQNKIFIVNTSNTFGTVNLQRSKSIRSNKSNAPSYISALQPTDDQLAEWRIRNHYTNDPTEHSTYSWLYNTDSFHYMEVVDNDRIYESLK